MNNFLIGKGSHLGWFPHHSFERSNLDNSYKILSMTLDIYSFIGNLKLKLFTSENYSVGPSYPG